MRFLYPKITYPLEQIGMSLYTSHRVVRSEKLTVQPQIYQPADRNLPNIKIEQISKQTNLVEIKPDLTILSKKPVELHLQNKTQKVYRNKEGDFYILNSNGLYQKTDLIVY